MKASDIVSRLALKLPNYVNDFTGNIAINSLTRSGSTATADTAAVHGRSIGDQVNIVGSESPLSISSLTRLGLVGTLVSVTDHDIREDSFTLSEVVKLSGSAESEFNGSFVILTVPNRKTITFTMANSGATIATGSPLLLNGSNYLQSYNGLFSVASVPTTTQFTYTLIGTPPLTAATGTIIAHTAPRVSSGISDQRCIDAYTKQSTGDTWAFVILGDVVASKSRKIDSDAVDNQQRGGEWRQQLIQPFDIMVIIPTSSEAAARSAGDLAHNEVFQGLVKSLVGFKFNSGLTVGAQNPVQFVDHGFSAYSTAFYVHSYSFQSVSDLTFSDTIGYDNDVAFLDIDTAIILDVGTGKDTIDADVNLDDISL